MTLGFLLMGLILMLLITCSQNGHTSHTADNFTRQAPAGPKALTATDNQTPSGAGEVLVGAGDIASCDDLAGARKTFSDSGRGVCSLGWNLDLTLSEAS